MGIENFEIAQIFSNVANLLELKGENPYRIRAYRNAARSISSWPQNISNLLCNHKALPHISGIGADLESKIKEICETRSLKLYEEMINQIPKELTMLLSVPNLGPKRVRLLWEKFKVKDFHQLKNLALNHKIQKIRGFGEKLESQILENIEKLHLNQKRMLWLSSQPIVESLIKYLKKFDSHLLVTAAGSFRRHQETVGDLDILVASELGENVITYFCNFPETQRVLNAGSTRASIILKSEIQVDLRVVPKESYGAALIYLTGSKNHNIEIRKIAQQKGLKINEYGVYEGTSQIAGSSETDVYQSIGLSYIEPELRENLGEIEAAKNNHLPHLINLEDICGDLHVHSKYSDGTLSLKEIVKISKSRGYQYIALTDHTQHLKVAHGLTVKEIRKEFEEIDLLNSTLSNFRILKSAEIDILEDGTLDLPDEVIREMDVVVCAIHSSFKLTKNKQTARILKAISHPCVNIFAHPTGRLIQERASYEFEIEQVIRESKNLSCALEINGQPTRLDLNDQFVRMAKEVGVKFSISSDSHSVSDFKFIELGVYQARRGWLEKNEVINTLPIKELLKSFRSKK